MRGRFLLILILVFPFVLKAQTLTGTSGLLNIPSADMQADGTFMMGANYLPKLNQPALGYNTGNFYFNVTFLPFLEVAMKNTLVKVSNGRYLQQDRALNLRLQLMKEKTYLPAVTLGVNNIYSEHENNNRNHIGSFYFVLTKHFEVDQTIIGLTSGYGFKTFQYNQFVGLFGGLSITPHFFKPLTFMGEYDGKGVNLGGSLLFFKHFYLLSMVQQLKYFAGGVAYRVHL
jgi:hypothetical protein